MYYGLSTPKNFCENEIVCSNLISVYNDLKIKFFSKEHRPNLKGVFIFVENYNEFGINKRFLHSVSIKDKQYYNSYPCVNDITSIVCTSKCDVNSNENICCTKSQRRAICYYRLARIHWISEIIQLANNNDINIKIWSKLFTDRTTGQQNIRKRFVWYKNGLANFVIIFEEKYRNEKLYCLKFVTAYPVFGRRAQDGFLNDYQIFCNK
ncbi:hypothetical protein psyc5s11_53460 [Clostridium gelidum]|uniref:Uncharacterized protein n=1 Tax=Clostridium gelidum TaxID=704125 RepID=A0ABM7TDE6_9CLOT|nr:hypothetical protein [Clostridium gelidum]BCZ49279.1 hypothetical protein psyc5s11_53460 [Clostridium gelidum]